MAAVSRCLGGGAAATLSAGGKRVASAGTSMRGGSLRTGTVRSHRAANTIDADFGSELGSGAASSDGGAARAPVTSSASPTGSGSIGGGTSGGGTAEAVSTAPWMIHSPCFGVGNGLDSASGSATMNTNTPHTTPAIRMAQLEIRSAEAAERSLVIPNPYAQWPGQNCYKCRDSSHKA